MGRKTSAKCLLCAELATKTHIVPRALALNLRGGGKHLVAGSVNSDGVEFSQNGLWEYLLCERHEAALGDADRYGVEFCKAAKQIRRSTTEPQLAVPNPKPELLLRFALSVIWRHVSSAKGKRGGLSLGPYEASIRSTIFDGAASTFQLGLSTSAHGLAGRPIDTIDLPTRIRFVGLTAWQFTTTTVTFITVISKGRLNSDFDGALASQNDPALVPVMPLLDLRYSQKAALERMARPRRAP